MTLIFTLTEHAIVQGVLDAKTNAQIAKDAGLTLQTVKTYLSYIFRRAGVESRAELGNLLRQPDTYLATRFTARHAPVPAPVKTERTYARW
jgi:DNA-binding NarL/FixJ family response regulator